MALKRQEFCCSLCLFDPVDHRHDPEWDNTLTVINGQMVCVDHQGFISSESTTATGARRLVIEGHA